MKKELKRVQKWVKEKNSIKDSNKEFRKKNKTWKHIDETVDKFNLVFEQLRKDKKKKA